MPHSVLSAVWKNGQRRLLGECCWVLGALNSEVDSHCWGKRCPTAELCLNVAGLCGARATNGEVNTSIFNRSLPRQAGTGSPLAWALNPVSNKPSASLTAFIYLCTFLSPSPYDSTLSSSLSCLSFAPPSSLFSASDLFFPSNSIHPPPPLHRQPRQTQLGR